MIPMGTKQREIWTQNNEKHGYKTTRSMNPKQREVWTQNNEKYRHKRDIEPIKRSLIPSQPWKSSKEM